MIGIDAVSEIERLRLRLKESQAENINFRRLCYGDSVINSQLNKLWEEANRTWCAEAIQAEKDWQMWNGSAPTDLWN